MTIDQLERLIKSSLDLAEQATEEWGLESAEMAAATLYVAGRVGRHMLAASGNLDSLPALEKVAEQMCVALDAQVAVHHAMRPVSSSDDN
jgi:hypothetical protein